MYFIAVIVFIILIGLVYLATMGGSFLALLDLVSLIGILLPTVPMLAASGLVKDFFRSFSIAYQKNCTADKQEIIRSMTAVKLMSILFLFSGILSSVLGVISMLHRLDDPAALGPNVSVALISLLYGIILNILLLPVKAKLEMLVQSFH